MSDTPDQDLKQQLQTTRAERDRLRAVLDGLPMGLYVISQNYDLEYVNPALQKVIGTPDGRTCHDQIHGLASPCTWCKNRQVFQGDIVRWEWSADNGQSFDLFDYRIVNADGSLSKVEVFNDITELKKSRQQLELASSLARVGYWDWTMATGALYWSDETYRVFGYEPGDLPPSYEWFIGQIHPDDRDYVDRMVQRSITTGADYQVDFRYFDRHGNLRSGRATGRVRFHLDGRPINLFGAMQDVTTLKNNEARLKFLAHYDPLTGLANRTLLRLRFDAAHIDAQYHDQKLALLLIDLDHFKTVNDSLGHPVGDRILLEIGHRLSNRLQKVDTISRFGGDEFLVLSRPMSRIDTAEGMALSILSSLADPISIDGQPLSTTFSIGIALWPDDAEEFDDLIKCAEVAMYRAKAEGRNTFCFFTEQMNLQAVAHLQLRNALNQALDRNELELHYQPQVNIRTGALTGAEALLRWRRASEELISPAQFIPLAEETGLIIPIGEWVLNQACKQAVRWQQAGLPAVPVSVNLSVVQFKRGNIETSVTHALAASGLDPALLDLELTESLLLEDVEHVLETLKRLKALGVKISIDDFGTGYSSLAYLKRFDVDTLKIDQSFVREIPTDPEDQAIVKAIIGMAHALRLEVLAEGVETEDMARRLQEYGCELAQGYLYARPLPAEAFQHWFEQLPK
jgi:diguanylate cyclase (GGDEF)-like protein/PAS domain S-box-containing protein